MRFSRFLIAALKDIFNKACTIANTLPKVCTGSVSLAHFSQGLQFERALFTALANTIEAKRITTTQYQTANGLVERWRKTLLGFGRMSRLTVFI